MNNIYAIDLTALMQLPLYQEVKVPEIAMADLVVNILKKEGTVDDYCPACSAQSTFSSEPDESLSRFGVALALTRGASLQDCVKQQPNWPSYQFQKTLSCARNPNHKLVSYFMRTENGFQKVGQFPSAADRATFETKHYRRALGNERLQELNRAIGLHAHGVGVGAFVYLRRIFESLVEEAHELAKADAAWDDAAYCRMRTAERVQALAGYLPDFMVENHQIYGLLSAHIHELSEDMCKANFSVVKEGICSIAEEKISSLQRVARQEASRKAIAEMNSKIRLLPQAK